MRLSVDVYEDLVLVPLPVRIGTHTADPVSSDFRRKHWAKAVPPEPHRFMTDFDTTLMKKIFDIPQRKRKPDV